MRKKGFLSRIVYAYKFALKRVLRFLCCVVAQRKSYALFGLPLGLTDIDFLKKEVGFIDTSSHPVPQTLESCVEQRLTCSDEVREVPGYYRLIEGMATDMGGQLTKETKLITTYLQSIDRKTPSQHDLFRFSTSRFSPRIYKSDQPIVTLCTGWQGAFYHWVYEVLPRLAIYKKAQIPLDRIFVEWHTSFQKESLALLGIDPEKIINSREYQAVSAPEILASSIPVTPTSWSYQFLVSSFTPHLKKESHLPKKLYLSRGDAGKRRVLNEKELMALLEGYGFTSVVMTKYSFKEQMNFFHNAEVIVAPHGAGLSHLAFAAPGTKVLEFFAPAYVINCYWLLANVAGLEYHYLLSEERPDPNPIDPDLFLDLGKVKKSLLQIL